MSPETLDITRPRVSKSIPSKGEGKEDIGLDSSPFFYIIVPTKDRAATLHFCLLSLLSQDYPHFSVIVSDNCSRDNTKQLVEGVNDSRIRYIAPDKPLSMRENWEFALAHVDGGWVSFIGDDDGLIPGALGKVAEVIRDTRVSAVTSSWCRYTWPGQLSHANKLVLPLARGVEIRDSGRWRRRVLSGGWRYIELPYIYTGGFVEYRVIKNALEKSATFFNSMNPDIYSGIAISLIIRSYAYMREPIAVRGTSFHSNGASLLKGSANNLPGEEFLVQNANTIHPALRDDKFPISIQLFVFECYLQAAFLAGESVARAAVADLERQLRIVKALSARRERPEVSEYCARILERAGRRAPGFKWRWPWSFFVKPLYFLIEAKRVLGSTLVDTAPLGVNDVYAAAILARGIHWYEGHRRFRRMRRIVATARVYLRARRKAPASKG